MNIKRIPWNKGLKMSLEYRKKLSEAHIGKTHSGSFKKGHPPTYTNTQEKHCNWKGNNAVKSAIHIWLVKYRGSPNKCEDCGIENSIKKNGKNNIEWSNKDHKYRRVFEDYNARCHRCHSIYDWKNGLRNNKNLLKVNRIKKGV